MLRVRHQPAGAEKTHRRDPVLHGEPGRARYPNGMLFESEGHGPQNLGDGRSLASHPPPRGGGNRCPSSGHPAAQRGAGAGALEAERQAGRLPWSRSNLRAAWTGFLKLVDGRFPDWRRTSSREERQGPDRQSWICCQAFARAAILSSERNSVGCVSICRKTCCASAEQSQEEAAAGCTIRRNKDGMGSASLCAGRAEYVKM